MSGALLSQFAQVSDAIAATTKKLQKYAILADYFRTLDDDDLRLAIRFAAGRTSGTNGDRVLNVGGSLVGETALSLLPIEPRTFWQLVTASGEIGEGIARAWPTKLPTDERDREGFPAAPNRSADDAGDGAALTLQEIAGAFDVLAETGSRERKVSLLRGLFSRCDSGRAAAYLAKIILGDMRTGTQAGVLLAAISRAFGREENEIQRCQLLVGDPGEVAVLARHGACASATFRLFHPIQFMLATPKETADLAAETIAGRMFYAEDKLDGIRAQVHKSGEGRDARVEIFTRTMDRIDGSFPDVAAAMAGLPGDFLLDGEIVPWQDGCVLPFAHIQKRLGRKVLTAKIQRENPVVFIAFDILYRDGRLLMDLPLRERRSSLQRLAPGSHGESGGTQIEEPADKDTAGLGDKEMGTADKPATPALTNERPNSPANNPADSAVGPRPLVSAPPCPHTSFPDPPSAAAGTCLRITEPFAVSTPAEITAAFEAARNRRNEGIVLKDAESPYSPGRRGQMWFKLKTHLPTLDCVVTAAENGHGKRRNSLSDYTFAVWDVEPGHDGATLVNVGKAYSGVTDEEIAQLTELFIQLTVENHGRVRIVEPKIVLEIACDQIQRSARHASGYALRFPRIKRIRWDKGPEEADRLSRVIEIYESSPNFARPTKVPPPPAPEPTLFD